MRGIFLVGLFVSLSGCAHALRNQTTQADVEQHPPPKWQASKIKHHVPAAPPTLQAVVEKKEAEKIEPVASPRKPGKVAPLGFLSIENSLVDKWIDYFSTKDRERFQRFLNRGQKYKSIIQNILKEEGVPPEFYYLAMIESGFVTHAHSRAGAKGVWQFIYATGKRYGLAVNSYVDERRDPLRATYAAAHYLEDLYNVFQTWPLAMSGYNAGEMRVLGAIMRSENRDYWTLCEKNLLPRETCNYVPKFIAAYRIGENYKEFGFKVDTEPFPELLAASIPGKLRLRDVAEVAGFSYEQLEQFNPHLRRAITPSDEVLYDVWVPSEIASRLKHNQKRLAKLAVQKRTRVASTDHGAGYHIVRAGDNLIQIANRYGTSVHALRNANNLRGSRIYVNQKLKLPSTGRSIVHTARRGDSLYSIAKLYNAKVSQIKEINDLRRNRILVGQKIRVPVLGTRVAEYRVRRGDHLTKIAKRFGVSVATIKRINALRSDQIYVGQVLEIMKSGRKRPIYHKVRRGENLTEIARRYGVSVRKIKQANDLRRNRIYVGETLKIQSSI